MATPRESVKVAETRHEDGRFANLYADLLVSALAAGHRLSPNPGECLLEVERRRRALGSVAADAEVPSAPEALSAQVAYDVALIRYARLLGLEVGPREFDPPARGRQRIEEELGIGFSDRPSD